MQHPIPPSTTGLSTPALATTEWWELYIQAPTILAEAVSDRLHDLGSTAVVVHDHTIVCPQQTPCIGPAPNASDWTVLQSALPADAQLADRINALQIFLQALGEEFPDTTWYLYSMPLRDTTYLTQWQQFFTPIRIDHHLLIRPPWETEAVSPSTACLTLEPGLAFGTGSHPTTYLALRLLAQRLSDQPYQTMLDVGCGSGILSLAALKLGASHAIGVDIEAQAIEVAAQNAALNQLQHQVRFVHGSWEATEGQFDLIAANVYLGPLMTMMQPLAQRLRPHGTLILSGILTVQEPALRSALDAAQLMVTQQLVKESWVALAVQHRNPAALKPVEAKR